MTLTGQYMPGLLRAKKGDGFKTSAKPI
ncbi:hypothetical protein [Aliarcobacter butzleri]